MKQEPSKVSNVTASEILKFWFEEIDQSQWWVKDLSFDQEIIKRFSSVHHQAISCELFEWRNTAEGRLAEIIVLDQFSRNMFRGSGKSFQYDSLALALAQQAIIDGDDVKLPQVQRSFMYLPFMHSESEKIHRQAMALYEKNGIQSNLDFEIKHKNIIDRFGRYPHRNKLLGRSSTAEEIQFLSEPGSSF